MVLPLGLEPRSSSNLEAMLGYKPSVLPVELREQNMYGVPSGSRTPDHLIKSQVLYLLS